MANLSDSSERDTLYVLITGANGGLGFATCTRLISSFFLSRTAPNQTLHLIPTTRSASKGQETKALLEAYIEGLASSKKPLLNYVRAGTASNLSIKDPQVKTLSPEILSLLTKRVIITPLALDLCSLKSVNDSVMILESLVPRIDSVICNAGIGGWLGLNWFGFFTQIWEEGLLETVGKPNYKICDLGAVVGKQIAKKAKEEDVEEEPKLGKVFCANVFGHYVLVHKIMHLLEREAGSELERGRVIWVSTLEAYERYFDLDDLQGLESNNAYESSKRLTDIISLSYTSRKTESSVASFTNDSASSTPTSGRSRKTRSQTTQEIASSSLKPKMLLCHPGICITPIMPLIPLLIALQGLVFMLVRMIGSVWHTVQPEKGATAPVWLVLEKEEVLDASKASKIKWGSIADRWGREGIKETEVEGDDTITFEDEGSICWKEMEELRSEWQNLMGDE